MSHYCLFWALIQHTSPVISDSPLMVLAPLFPADSFSPEKPQLGEEFPPG